MSSLLKFCSVAVLLTCAAACNKPATVSKGSQIHASGILADQTLAPSDRAERLAKAAEQLVTVQGFVYADSVADLALAADPTNLRAQFIKAVLAPVIATKGSLARVAPLAAKDATLQKNYDTMMSQLESLTPNSTVKTFLLDGAPDLVTEGDAQAYFDHVALGFEKLRQFAKNNKDQTLTVMASDSFYQALEQRWKDSCELHQTGDYDWDYSCPSNLNMMEITLSRGDFEALESLAAGYELYFSLPNSYDLSGAFDVVMAHQKETASPQTIIAELLSTPSFGQLRAASGLHRIREMGLDAVMGVRWVMNNQNTLCPDQKDSGRNRMGALFNRGLCIEPSQAGEVATNLRQAERLLNGGTYAYSFYDRNNALMTTLMKPIALSETPLADLRALTPLTFDECGSLASVGDATLGGLLPQGDANKLLAAGNACAPSSVR